MEPEGARPLLSVSHTVCFRLCRTERSFRSDRPLLIIICAFERTTPLYPLSSFPLLLQRLEINCTLNAHSLSENLMTVSTLNGQHLKNYLTLCWEQDRTGWRTVQGSEESGSSVSPLESPH